MSADARVWCETNTEAWEGWVDGSKERPRGGLTEVISELERLGGGELHWLPTEHANGPALSGYFVPRGGGRAA